MRKTILHGFVGVFCFAIVTGCGKDVKAPSNRPASAAKTSTTSSPVTQSPDKDQNNPTCGSQGSSGSSSSDTYTTGY